MPIQKKKNVVPKNVREGLSRRLIHTPHLMMAVIEFTDGPWPEPEPLHQHVHEQATYVAKGEIIFYCEGESAEELSEGDMFWVPSGKKHGIRLMSNEATLIDTFHPLRDDFLTT